MQDIIKIMIKYPGEPPILANIENDPAAFRNIIGGSLEHLGMDVLKGHRLDSDGKVGILMDADGKIKRLKPNFKYFGEVISGTVVFIGEKDGRITSLSKRQQNILNSCFQ